MSKNYGNINELASFINKEVKGNIVVFHQNLPEYPGMVLYMGLSFDISKAVYKLNLEWMSLGLDYYGDTLYESYKYQFDSLDECLKHLNALYNIKVTDIAIKYEFDFAKFPHLLKDRELEPLFKLAWERFQKDFREGIFLEPSLKMVYSTLNR